jgi:hypothetical protein
VARLADAVAGGGLDAEEDRPAGAARGLEAGGHLPRVHRIHPAVALGGEEEHGRVLLARPDALIRRVGVQPTEAGVRLTLKPP